MSPDLIQTMNISLALAAMLINFAFAIVVLARTSRSVVYVTFVLICVSIIVWNFGLFMRYFSESRSWFYLSLMGSPWLPALLFHFINALIGARRARPWVITGYVLAGLLSFSSLAALFLTPARRFVDSRYWNIYFLAALFPFVFASAARLRDAIRRAGTRDERSRLRYIFAATIIGALMGLTDLVQILNVPVPKLGHPASVLYSTILAVGVFKHRRAYDILEQMRTRVSLLSETAAGIAHEIRNPLASLKGAAGLLAGELAETDTPRVGRYLDLIKEEIERLDTLLSHYQHLTKEMQIEKAPVCINEIVRRTIDLAESVGLNARIVRDLSDDMPVAAADASMLRQVFLNLIKNASEACCRGGELVITTAYDPPWVKILFRDSGPGLPPGAADRIFEPFFTTKAGGMGLGLAISRRIVQAHGGRLEARNAAGGGAELAVLLPA
jgi:signal transduction histidine kinase